MLLVKSRRRRRLFLVLLCLLAAYYLLSLQFRSSRPASPDAGAEGEEKPAKATLPDSYFDVRNYKSGQLALLLADYAEFHRATLEGRIKSPKLLYVQTARHVSLDCLHVMLLFDLICSALGVGNRFSFLIDSLFLAIISGRALITGEKRRTCVCS